MDAILLISTGRGRTSSGEEGLGGSHIRRLFGMGNQNSRGRGKPPTGQGGHGAAALLARAAGAKRAAHPSDFDLRVHAHHGLPPSCCCLSFDPIHRVAAFGTSDGSVKLVGAEGVEILLHQRGRDDRPVPVTFLVFLPSQQRLVVVFSDSAVKIFDLAARKQVAALDATWTSSRVTACFYPTHSRHSYLYLATDDGVVHVVNARDLYVIDYTITPGQAGVTDPEPRTGEPPEVVALASSPTREDHLLIAYEFGGLVLWDLAKRRVVRAFDPAPAPGEGEGALEGEEPALRCIVWHAAGTQFAAGHEDGRVAVYRADRRAAACAQFADGGADLSTPRRPVRKLDWVVSPALHKGPGCLVAAGGTLASDPVGVAVVWQDPPEGSDGARTQAGWRAEASRSVVLPTADGCSLLDFAVMYPPGCGPGATPANPSGLLVLSGDPMQGREPHAFVHPLPSAPPSPDGDPTVTGRGGRGGAPDEGCVWPPIAADPPRPLPMPLPAPPLLQTRLHVDNQRVTAWHLAAAEGSKALCAALATADTTRRGGTGAGIPQGDAGPDTCFPPHILPRDWLWPLTGGEFDATTTTNGLRGPWEGGAHTHRWRHPAPPGTPAPVAEGDASPPTPPSSGASRGDASPAGSGGASSAAQSEEESHSPRPRRSTFSRLRRGREEGSLGDGSSEGLGLAATGEGRSSPGGEGSGTGGGPTGDWSSLSARQRQCIVEAMEVHIARDLGLIQALAASGGTTRRLLFTGHANGLVRVWLAPVPRPATAVAATVPAEAEEAGAAVPSAGDGGEGREASRPAQGNGDSETGPADAVVSPTDVQVSTPQEAGAGTRGERSGSGSSGGSGSAEQPAASAPAWSVAVATAAAESAPLVLLNEVDATAALMRRPEDATVTALAWCPQRQALVVGFNSGEVSALRLAADGDGGSGSAAWSPWQDISCHLSRVVRLELGAVGADSPLASADEDGNLSLTKLSGADAGASTVLSLPPSYTPATGAGALPHTLSLAFAAVPGPGGSRSGRELLLAGLDTGAMAAFDGASGQPAFVLQLGKEAAAPVTHILPLSTHFAPVAASAAVDAAAEDSLPLDTAAAGAEVDAELAALGRSALSRAGSGSGSGGSDSVVSVPPEVPAAVASRAARHEEARPCEWLLVAAGQRVALVPLTLPPRPAGETAPTVGMEVVAAQTLPAKVESVGIAVLPHRPTPFCVALDGQGGVHALPLPRLGGARPLWTGRLLAYGEVPACGLASVAGDGEVWTLLSGGEVLRCATARPSVHTVTPAAGSNSNSSAEVAEVPAEEAEGVRSAAPWGPRLVDGWVSRAMGAAAAASPPSPKKSRARRFSIMPTGGNEPADLTKVFEEQAGPLHVEQLSGEGERAALLAGATVEEEEGEGGRAGGVAGAKASLQGAHEVRCLPAPG